MTKRKTSQYSTEDVIKNANKLLQYSENEKINPGLFLHSLIFTSEFMIKKFGFIPKDIAEIRRQSRLIISHAESTQKAPLDK